MGQRHLFSTVTGNLIQPFNNPDSQFGGDVGFSVSIDGTNALIGAPTLNAGSAYLFDITNGNLLQTFNNPTPQSGDEFGYSVSLSGKNALIGDYLDNTGATDAGSADLFDTETGNLLQTLNNPDPQTDDRFGWSVSISDSNALIGAVFEDTGANNAGSAYLYQQQQQQQVPEPSTLVGTVIAFLCGISFNRRIKHSL